jgi:Na+/melibiose symporter-like transporter
LKDHYGVTRDSWGLAITGLMYGSPLLFGSLACLGGGLLTDWFIRKTGNRKWGRRLFGVLGHGVCSAFYVLSIFAADPWLFVIAITLATFCNDMTMGSAWASCIDIGRRYSGIVSGCMNTIGNLGGAAAGYATGWILDLWAGPQRTEMAQNAATMIGNSVGLGASGGLPGGAGGLTIGLGQVLDSAQQVQRATHHGWEINFFTFAAVYAAATLFWLAFDSTKPIIPDEPAPSEPPRGGPDSPPSEHIRAPQEQIKAGGELSKPE